MYLTAVKAARALFWAALVAGILSLLMPEAVPIWLGLGLGIACGLCFFFAVFHVHNTRRHELRCPFCAWVPFAVEAWKCKECGFVWDSFGTGGACPRCGHQHDETACARCRKIFPMERWQA
jgi:hypothetical protein